MADELSRVGDRLARARERTWNSAASLLLPVRGSRDARREPKRVPSAHDREREQQARDDAGAEKKRPPTTLVAIHVEVRHPTEPGSSEDSARFVEAQVDDVAAAHQDEFAIEHESAAPVELAYEIDGSPEPVFAPPALAASLGTYNRKGRVSGAIHYLAARAVSAYLAQRSLSSSNYEQQRLVDTRA